MRVLRALCACLLSQFVFLATADHGSKFGAAYRSQAFVHTPVSIQLGACTGRKAMFLKNSDRIPQPRPAPVMASGSRPSLSMSLKQHLENSLKVAAIASALFLGVPAIAEMEPDMHPRLPVVVEKFSSDASPQLRVSPKVSASERTKAWQDIAQIRPDGFGLLASAEAPNSETASTGTIQKDPQHVVLDEVLDLVCSGKSLEMFCTWLSNSSAQASS